MSWRGAIPKKDVLHQLKSFNILCNDIKYNYKNNIIFLEQKIDI